MESSHENAARLELDVRRRERVTTGGDDAWVVEAYVPPDLHYFRGHFEGHAILPAVVQLETFVVPQVTAIWPELVHLRRLQKLKFRRRIPPSSTLHLHLERKGWRVSFRIDVALERSTSQASSGALVFTAGP